VDTSSRRDVPHGATLHYRASLQNQASLRLLSYVDRKSSEIICTIRKIGNAPLPRSPARITAPAELRKDWIDGTACR